MLEGQAEFILEDVELKDQRIVNLNKTSRGLLIPPSVAHKVKIEKNSILIGATQEPYTNSEQNNIKYDF